MPKRVLAIGSLIAVAVVLALIVARRPVVLGSADGGGYFGDDCGPGRHWVMAAGGCSPDWRPGEP